MFMTRHSISCIFALLFIGIAIGTAAPAALGANLPLADKAVVIERPATVLSDAARQFLFLKNEAQVNVWVFFTDKGVFTQSEFDAKAASVFVSEKAMARRAKMGLDRVVFTDLPVVADYVDKVAAEGATVRRVSRYLNAASFSIDPAKLDLIASLPFVARVAPVAHGVRENPVADTDEFGGRPQAPGGSLAPNALNYGAAFDQLDQIGVPAVHNKGYTGQGITLAIFDTGFRKTHQAFAQHYAENRVLGEWDFVFEDGNTSNEAADWSSQWNHGTYIWGTSGGYLDGTLYGPAYKANFLLAKTEDVRTETSVEEDNWVAAVEWADSAGADVITSSLGYLDWYTYADFDGQTATITIAANTADSLGILVVTSMGNEGPAAGTLSAPADAFNSISCGAVSVTGFIASFSSRGPTFDGRMKPEVVACGVSTYCSSSSADNSYTTVSGTSLSTPLIAGCAAVLMEARPNFTPAMIRLALMETADRADNPDNTYGWGLMNLDAALGWGANFSADVTVGPAPLTVQFTDESTVGATAWDWDFGDGFGSTDQNPSHQFTEPGVYDVSLSVQSSFGEISSQKAGFVAALGDTLTFVSDSAYAGSDLRISVNLSNSQQLEEILIPFKIGVSPIGTKLDSVTFGSRTAYFQGLHFVSFASTTGNFTVNLVADEGLGFPPLAPGSGEIMRIYLTPDSMEIGGQSNVVDTFLTVQYALNLKSTIMDYTPTVNSGYLSTRWVDRGDLNGNGQRTLTDLTIAVNRLFLGGTPPVAFQAIDVNADLQANLTDLTFLVNYLFLGGPPPPTP
jgi:PKD repeat protein